MKDSKSTDYLNNEQKEILLRYATQKGYLRIVELLAEKGVNLEVTDNEDKTLLHLAAQEGKLEVVEFLLSKGADVNAQGKDGKTPLHLAALNGHLDIVKYLIDDKKADFAVKSNDGLTPLHLAALNGHLDTVKYLIDDKKADFAVKANDGKTPLHLAALNGHLDIVKYLIDDKKADFAVKANDGRTPLHFAAKNGHLDTVKYLIDEKKADVNAQDKNGKTPLHLAASNGHLDIVKYLIDNKKADFNAKSNDGWTPLHTAAQNGHLETVKYLVEEKNADVNVANKDGRTPLHSAAQNGHLETVKYFIDEKKADFNAQNKDGWTPLHLAAQNGHLETVKYFIDEKKADFNAQNKDGWTSLHSAAQNGHLETIKYLVDEKNADFNVKANDGSTSLHLAAQNGHLDTVKYLIDDKKADFAVKANDGKTPLHLAALNGHLDIVKYLIDDKKADFAVKANDGRTPLHFAAKNGHLDTVKYLIDEKKADVNAQDKNGKTPLHLAASNGHLDIVKYLIDNKKADFNAKSNDGWTPLHTAAQNGHLETVKYLVEEKNADVNVANKDGRTPLHSAAQNGHLETVKYFIDEKKADFNAQNKDGWTPLHLAAQNGHLETVKYFIDEKKADFNAQNKDGWTSLHSAAQNGHLETIKYLVDEKNADFNVKANDGSTSLHLAAQNGHLDTVKYLIDDKKADFAVKDNDGRTPLHLVAESGKLEVVEYLVGKVADVNAKDNNHGTPLHGAVLNGYLETVRYLIERGADVNAKLTDSKAPLHWAAESGNLEVVKLLIEKEADLNSRDKYGKTPLNSAAYNRKWEVVKLLIEKEADLNIADKDGWAPLHWAASSREWEVVKLLIEKGADLNFPDKYGKTPLHLAAQEGKLEVVEYLVGKGANVKYLDNDGQTPLCWAAYSGNLKVVKLLIEKGAVLNSPNNDGKKTPLHWAAESGNLEVVKLLIEKEADLNSRDEYGKTPLNSAAYNRKWEVVKLLLIEKGADTFLNVAEKDGWTPLHWAARSKKWAVVKLLIEKGADLNFPDKYGKTPLHLAAQEGKLEVVEYLIDQLVKKGDDLKVVLNVADKDGQTPLHLAAYSGKLEVVKLLIEKGADLNSPANDDQTPLHLAVNPRYGEINFELVKYLVEKGADFKVADKEGSTPLHRAAKERKWKIVEYLIEKGADFKVLDSEGKSPLKLIVDTAVSGGSFQALSTLTEIASEHETRSLELIKADDYYLPKVAINAVTFGDSSQILYELKKIASKYENVSLELIKANDYYFSKAAVDAFRSGGHYEILYELMKIASKYESVSLELIKANDHHFFKAVIDTVVSGSHSQAFLRRLKKFTSHKSTFFRNELESIKKLLLQDEWVEQKPEDKKQQYKNIINISIPESYVDSDTESGYGSEREQDSSWYLNTKLLSLLDKVGSTDEIRSFLQQKEIDINENHPDNGETLLHFVIKKGNVELVELLLDERADVNAKTKHEFMPLHLAAQSGYQEIVKVLLGKGAQVDAETEYKNTALQLAAKNGYLGIAEALLASDASINTPDKDGFTPLHWAALNGHKEVVNNLLKNRQIDINAQTTKGNTPLHFAAEQGYLKIVEALVEKDAHTGVQNKEDKTALDLTDSTEVKDYIIQHQQATFNRRQGTSGISGQLYEIELSMLFLLQGITKKEDEKIDGFHLATNMEEAGDFDDVVFKYKYKEGEVEKSKVIFLQAKHRENPEKEKITIDKLLLEPTKNNKDFSLIKYFTSYRKIKQQFSETTNDPILNSELEDCDFIIYTNALFTFSSTDNSIKGSDIEENDFLKISDSYTKYYQLEFNSDKKEEIINVLESSSDCRKLAKELVASISSGKGIDMQKDIFKSYHVALAGNVIEKTQPRAKEGKLNDNFLNNDAPSDHQEFRRTFFEEAEKVFNKQGDELKQELQQKTIKFSDKFGVSDGSTNSQLPNDLITEGEINEFLSKLKLFVGQPNESDLGKILREKIQSTYSIEQNDIDTVFSDVKNKVERWWKEKSEYLTESNKFFQESARVSISFDVKKPVDLFTGRREELSDLHSKIQRGSEKVTVISQMTSISGLGGVGKTELAREYINEHSQDYDNNVIWIDAESEATLIASFRRLAEDKLRISTKNVNGKEKDIKSIVEEVYKFFSKRKSLVIFDNAEKGEDFNKFLPLRVLKDEDKKPYIVITSRNKEWKRGIEVIELKELKLGDAIEFVKKGLGTEDESQDKEIRTLVEKLQRFPLAIQQAVAYIEDQRVTGEFEINDYLTEYEKKTKELLKSEIFRGIDNDYTKTTFTTWQITIDKIRSDEQNGQLALKILDVIAYFAPENINREMFLDLAGGNEEQLKLAVRLLVKYSMVNGEQKQSVLSIHRLVQQVTRINLNGQNKEEKIVVEAFDLLKESFPYGSDKLEDYAKKRQLLPHLEVFLSHIDDWLARTPEDKQKIEKDYLTSVLIWMGHGYGDLGDPQKKKELLERALAIKEKQYGPDHFEVAGTLVNLGNAYGDLGDPQKQKELYERALAIQEKHYGRDHFEVARTLVNLGVAYGDLGDPQKKKELLERALAIQEKQYGPDHFEVARTLVNLGNAYGALGDPQKQKELLERALVINEKQYGPDHFEVARALVNLGVAYGDLGDPQKKKELLERALVINEKQYGPDHFEVARALVNLGVAYGDLGDPQKKKELLERALVINEKQYGPDHFEVARTLVNLGNAYGDLGDPQKQKELLERALVINEKQYGPDHFEVARTLVNLGNAYGALGDPQKQKELLERALVINEKQYGPDHFEVARTLGNLGSAYGALGDPQKKKELLERALAIEEKQYGPDHFEVAMTLNNLGNAYSDLGDPQKQKELLERALAIKEKQYGPDHFEVARTLGNLGNAYGDLGDPQKQKELLERALAIEEKQYGPDHFEVARTLVNLGVAYGDLGDPQKQKELYKRALPIFEGNNHPIVTELRRMLDELGSLHFACRNGNLDMVKTLVEEGSDVLARNNHDTVLHQAVSSNNEEIIRLILDKIKEKDPQNFSEHINAKDTEGDTPLMWAAQSGKVNAAKILLEYDADVNAKNSDDERALHWAAKGGYQEIVQLLLNKRADPNKKDKNGKTSLDLTSEKLVQDPENENLQTITGLLLSVTDEPFSNLNQQIHSNKKQQKAFSRLSKYIDINIPNVETKAVKQGLYLPPFENRNIKIDGKCAAITRMFSQGLFLEQQVHESLLSNLQTSAELYERLAQGKQISSREEKEIFALSRLLNSIEEELTSPTSSLPSHLSHIKSYKTLDDLSLYVSRLTDDFAIHLVTSNHVVAIYRTGDSYTYFDSNVAFVSNLKTVDQLMKVVKKGVEYAGYALAEEGFLVEHFDVTEANNALTTQQKEILEKPIQTERHLLSLQDQELGPIDVNGEQVSRVTLYDMGAKLHVDGSAPVLINSEMSSEDLVENLNSGKIKITAREYLQNLKGNTKEVVQDLVQKVSPLSFDGSINEVKDAQTIQNLVLSEDGQMLDSYQINKILKGPIEQSIKALPYYMEVANTKHWPNRLTNAAGRISMAKGFYDIAHSIRYGDTKGFLLGSGEIGFSLFSQLIEDGVVKVAPQVIKQMKHGIFLTRGFAGLISSPFDIYDLVSSSIDLANSKKGSKEWRDSIAGVAFSGTSVTTGVAFTALGKSGVGTVVGLGILIGQGFYSGTSMVIEYKKYKLTTNQEFRLFWYTFALQLPPEDVQYLSARKDVVNGLAQQAWEFLQNNTHVAAYGMGLGEIRFVDRVKRSIPGSMPKQGDMYMAKHSDFDKMIQGMIAKPKEVKVEPSSSTIGMSNPSNERNGQNLSRIVPISPSSEAEMLCLPQFTYRDYEYDNSFGEKPMYSNSSTAIYHCSNAIIVGRKNDTIENPVMVFDLSLVNGNGLIVSSSKYNNQFNIAEGGMRIRGSNHTSNIFSSTNDNFFGTVTGGTENATNVLDVSQLKSKALSYENNIITTQEAQMTAENIDHFIGRKAKAEHVDCQNMNTKIVIDSRGGNGRNSDVVSNCRKVIVTGNTKVVSNESDNIFYIKPSSGRAEIEGAGKGFAIFSDTALLQRASNVGYSATNNTLSFEIKGRNNGTFTLDINNYLDEGKNHNYVIIDKYGSVIEPLIQPNNSTHFNLKAETNLTNRAEVAQRYQEISQVNGNYTVYGVVRDSEGNNMIFGSEGSDVIPLTQNVTFAQGNEKSDVYTLIPEEKVNVTINNYDEKKALDILYLPTDSIGTSRVEDDLHITADNTTSNIKVENYFRNSSYQHLTVIDKDKNTFLPWPSKQSYVQLVPFFHATKDQYIFLLSKEKVQNNPEIIVNAKLDDIKFYRNGNDLMLTDDKPLIVKLESFYDNKYGNFTLNFRSKEKLSSKQLYELAKIAINYQDEIRSSYYDSFREYRTSTFNSTIHHNQRFVNGSLTTVEPDDKRVGILLLKDPADIEVSADNNDLVFFAAQSNATFVIKNWNDTDHRISMLKFGQEDKSSIEVRKLDQFDLSQVSEIQAVINKAAMSNALNEQLEKLNGEIVNGLKYLFASNGIVNGINTYNCLGFDSIEDQQEFVAAYSTLYNKEKLEQILQDSQVAEALRWLIAKGHTNVSLKDPDKGKDVLLKELDQCFGAKGNFTIENRNQVSVLKFNQTIEVDLSEVSEIQHLISKYDISNVANQQLGKLDNEEIKYLLVSLDIENGIEVYNCVAEKDTQNVLNPYYYEWVNWNLVKNLIKFDVNSKANDGNTILHEAASSGKLDVVKYLVDEKKADVNSKANDGRTPLHHAAFSGSLGLVKYLVDEKGVDVNAKDNYGRISLYHAASSGNLDLVKYLVEEKGVDVNTKDNYGRTPLYYAASAGSLDLVKYLVEEKRVDVNTKDNEGKSVLHYAATSGNLDSVKYLVEEKRIDVNAKDNYGNICLHEAAYSGNLDLVKYLIDKGADVNAKTSGNWTPLHKAAEKGYKEIALALLDKGVDVNARTNGGWTALHWAAYKGNKETVLALLNNGANVNAKIDSGETPLDIAEQHGKGEIVGLLRSNSSETHGIRHTTTHQRSSRAIKEVPIITANDNLEFFVAQSNATPVMVEEKATSSSTRTSSLINDLFGWVKSSIGELFHSRAALPENNTTQSSISQVDAQVNVDGTILLLDVFIRKITGQKYVSSVDKSISLLEAQGYASSITLGFDTLLKRTARSCGIQDTNFNPIPVQSTIVGHIRNGKFSEISKILYSSAEKACPDYKQTDKFLARLKGNLKDFLAEKEAVFKGDVSSSKVPERAPAARLSKENGPSTILNGTSIAKGLSYAERVRVESSKLKDGARIG